MQLARVIGDVVRRTKSRRSRASSCCVIQPLSPDGQDTGRPLVAVDSVGAGVGERVFFVRGKEASFPFHPDRGPGGRGHRRHHRSLVDDRR